MVATKGGACRRHRCAAISGAFGARAAEIDQRADAGRRQCAGRQRKPAPERQILPKARALRLLRGQGAGDAIPDLRRRCDFRDFRRPGRQPLLPMPRPCSGESRARARSAARRRRDRARQHAEGIFGGEQFVFRACRYGRMCRSWFQAALQFDHRPPDPAFHGAERHFHARGQVLIGIAVEKGAAQRAAFMRRQAVEAAMQPRMILRSFPARCRRSTPLSATSAAASIGSMRRLCLRCAQPVDGAVARDRDQPGHRACPAGVEIGGFAPYRHIDLLQHVLGFAAFTQDTQATPKSFAEVRR